jgi:hypothetical protein
MAGWQTALIIAAGIILIIGIAWAILADAKQRAPAETGEHAAHQAETRTRNEAERVRRKEQARAKSRRARAARKRNR